MTTASPVSSIRPVPEATPTRTKLDADAFLTLLVAQLRAQDPTSPIDTGEYMAQLASFSVVEQAVQQNARLDRLLDQGRIAQAAELVGLTITSADGTASGVVAEVRIASGAITALLDNGATVAIGDGVTIGR